MIDLQRLLKRIGITQIELAALLDVKQPSVSNVSTGRTPFPEEWKKTTRDKYGIDPDEFESQNTQGIVRDIRARYGKPLPEIAHDPNGKGIPAFEGMAFATISPAMGDVVALKQDTFIRIPMFSQGEFAVQVTGHSMKGYINHADWCVIKRITNRDAVIYGEPYLIITKSDNLKTVKFLKAGDEPDTFWLVPYNVEQFEPQEIKKNEVLELYRVVGVFRTV